MTQEPSLPASLYYKLSGHTSLPYYLTMPPTPELARALPLATIDQALFSVWLITKRLSPPPEKL